MNIKRLTMYATVLVGMLGPIQARADEAHLITSFGTFSPEYNEALEQFNRVLDAHDATCAADASTCDDWSSVDAYRDKLDATWKAHPNKAKVTVRGLDEPTTLVLASPVPIVWRVRGTDIKKIVLVGAGKADVKLSKALEGVEVQDLSGQVSIAAFTDDRRAPAAFSDYNFETGEPVCPTQVDETVAEWYPSELDGSIAALKEFGLELASAQADSFDTSPTGRFRVGRNTRGILLSESFYFGFCYQEPDGSLVTGEELQARRSQ